MRVFNTRTVVNNKTRNVAAWNDTTIWTRSRMQGPEIASMLRYAYILYIMFILCSFLITHLLVPWRVSRITWK